MYDSLTNDEIQVDGPLKQELFQKIKDNLDFLYGLIATLNSTTIANGSFEIDSDEDGEPDNWDINLYAGGTFEFDETTPSHGARAIKFTSPGGASNGGGYADSDYVEITDTEISYSIGFIMKGTATVRNIVEVREYDKDKVYQSTQTLYSENTGNPTAWTHYAFKYNPATGINYIKVRLIGCEDTDTTAGATYFDNIVFQQLMDASVTLNKIKLVTDSSSLAISDGTEGTIDLVNYSHFPRQKTSSGSLIQVWIETAIDTTYRNRIAARNEDSMVRTWYVEIDYHSSSEQILLIVRHKDTDDILGYRITEKGNENSVALYDKAGNQIQKIEVLTKDSHPAILTKIKKDKWTAQDIHDQGLIEHDKVKKEYRIKEIDFIK